VRWGGGGKKRNVEGQESKIPLDLSTTKRESVGAEEREPPERASLVDFSKKSSISSVLMFALHAFFPFREVFAFFPISLSLFVSPFVWAF
jgi:hypothetical protein